MIQFKCPNCQKALKVKAEHAGRRVACPGCTKPLIIPRPAAPSAAPARPAPVPPAPPVSSPAAPARQAPAPPPVPSATAPARQAAAKPGQPPKIVDLGKNTPRTPEDIEAMAAAALADNPPAAKAEAEQEKGTVDFNCYYCDEKIQLSISLAGKQAPCPKCRRIIKVPQVRKVDTNNWQKVEERGPTLARREEDETPSGAWGSETTVSRVSRETLEAAQVIPKVRQRWTVRQWINRSVAVLVLLGIVISLWIYGSRRWTRSQQDKAVALAASYEARQLVPPLGAAAVRRAVGEYYARAGEAARARDEFTASRSLARGSRDVKLKQTQGKTSPEHDAFFIDLARTQVELVQEPTVIEKSLSQKEVKLEQERAFLELKRTLNSRLAPEARAETFRQATRALIRKHQGDQAPALAWQLELDSEVDRAELQAVVGLELWRAGEIQAANTVADRLLGAQIFPVVPKAGAQPGPVIAPSLVALCIVLAKPEERIKAMQPKKMDERAHLAWAMGWADGQARLDPDKAQRFFEGLAKAQEPLNQLDLWRVQAAIGAACLEKNPPDVEFLQQVVALAEGLKDKLGVEEEGKPSPSWTLLRLVQLSAEARQPALAKRLMEVIPDPALRGRAQLELLRVRLEDSQGWEADSVADEVDVKASLLAHLMARELLARHNARHSSGSTLSGVASWDPEMLRPFGYAGVALGIQDSSLGKDKK